jgi:hypothetical protein
VSIGVRLPSSRLLDATVSALASLLALCFDGQRCAFGIQRRVFSAALWRSALRFNGQRCAFGVQRRVFSAAL